jgi:hypothetical protein
MARRIIFLIFSLRLFHFSQSLQTNKNGLKFDTKPRFSIEVLKQIGAINVFSFSRSYCLHPIYDPDNAANIFQRGTGPIPLITTEDGCPNILIWFSTLDQIVHQLASRNLPREGKYVILSSLADTNGTLRRLVAKEMFVDVKFSVLSFDSVSSPRQLGIAVGANGRVDLQGRTLKVVGFQNPPFTVYDEKKRVLGVEMRVVRELAEALNFTWTFHEPLDGQLWGHFDKKKRAWTGLRGNF